MTDRKNAKNSKADKASASPLKARRGVDIVPKPIDWLWRNVLPSGALASITGAPGIGKTYLLCAVAAAVTTGGSVQGTDGELEQLQRGNVLYLSGDDSIESTLYQRLQDCGVDMRYMSFQPEGELPKFGSTGLAELFDDVKPKLAIFDTIQHFFPAHTSINDMASTTAALQPVKLLAEKYGCAVVIIQHLSKSAASGNGGSNSIGFSLGSSAINGLFRSVWTLGQLKDSDGYPTNTIALCPTKTNLVAETLPALLASLTPESGFEWTGVDYGVIAADLYGSAKRGRGRPSEAEKEAEEFLCDFLSSGKELAIDVIAASRNSGISVTTLHRAKKTLGVQSVRDGELRFWEL